MKPRHPQLPKGARIYLPDEAERKRHVEGALLDVFRRWGYREIVTPTFEYSDVLATGTDEAVQEQHVHARRPRDRSDAGAAAGHHAPDRARGGDPAARRAQADPPRLRDERVPLRRAARVALPRVLPGGRRAGRARPARGRGRDHRDGHRGAARARARAVPDRPRPPRLLPRPPRRGEGRPGHRRELRAALARKDGSTLERLVADLAPPAHVRDALLRAADALRPRGGARARGRLRAQRARRRARSRTWPRCTGC